MAEAGNALLPLLYPDFYAKMLPIERRQAMANMLMQQGSGDPGNAKFGGLRNAGNMLAGALLGRSSDRQLGELYSGPQSPGIHDTGQVTNDPQPQPDLQGNVQPQASQLNLYPGVSPDTQGPAPNAPQPRAQALGGALLGQTPQSQGGPPQAPQAAPTAPVNDGGLPVLPGLSKQSSMMLLLTNPGEYLSAVAKNAAPTDFQKIVGQVYRPGTPEFQQVMSDYLKKQTTPDTILQDQFAGKSRFASKLTPSDLAFLDKLPPEVRSLAYQHGPQSPEFQTALGQLNAKQSAIPLRSPTIIDGKVFSAPNGGIFTPAYKPGELPTAVQQPGYAQASAGIEGAKTAAQQANTIMPIGLGGRTGVPVPGSEIFNAWRGGQYQPLTGSAPPPSQPGAPGGQPQPGGNVPGIGGLPLGTSPADTAAGAKTGDMAATAAEAKATTESLLKSIDDAIAESRGFGGFHMGIGPEKWAQAGQRVGYPEAMTHLNNYNQLVGVGILNGLQNLRGLGRADLPEVNEVVKTYGVDANNDPKVREAGLMNLKTIVQRAAAAKQNAVANMNAPGAVTNTTQQPMGAGGPPQSQFHEGQTATGPGNKQIIFRNGQWVPK